MLGQDWETIVIDSDDPGLTRAIVQARADRVTSPQLTGRVIGQADAEALGRSVFGSPSADHHGGSADTAVGPS
ncbi:hypothetical protein [Streptomyces sp. NPDC002172]